MTTRCFWCEEEIKDAGVIKCVCGRILCKNCDDDGLCADGDGCPAFFSRMARQDIFSRCYGSFEIVDCFERKTRSFIIRSLEILIEDLKNSTYREPTRFNTKDYPD